MISARAPKAVGILANPRAGSDVRRLAARAGSSTLESKRNQVLRAAVGARAGGAEKIFIARDPLRIAEGALANLDLDVHGLENDPLFLGELRETQVGAADLEGED